MTLRRRDELDRNIQRWRALMRESGGDLGGYVLRYGAADDPSHRGDGGEAIYAADAAWLAKLRERAARRGGRCAT